MCHFSGDSNNSLGVLLGKQYPFQSHGSHVGSLLFHSSSDRFPEKQKIIIMIINKKSANGNNTLTIDHFEGNSREKTSAHPAPRTQSRSQSWRRGPVSSHPNAGLLPLLAFSLALFFVRYVYSVAVFSVFLYLVLYLSFVSWGGRGEVTLSGSRSHLYIRSLHHGARIGELAVICPVGVHVFQARCPVHLTFEKNQRKTEVSLGSKCLF